MKLGKLVIIAGVLMLSFSVSVFACGGAGPCEGTRSGRDAHAYLTIYDRGHGNQILVPRGLGLDDVEQNGKQTFCYHAVHTHDDTGILHLVIAPKNDLRLSSFLGTVWKNPAVQQAKTVVNGKQVSSGTDVKIKPEMDIKIFVRFSLEQLDLRH